MSTQTVSVPTFTMSAVFKRFRGKVALTIMLVILEAATNLFFPLFMGFAINGLLDGSFDGLIALAVLGFASLTISALRRVYDSRAYAKIYTIIVGELVEKEQKQSSSVSKISARANLLTEMVEFFENSFPEVINSLIATFGTLLIILPLNVNIFFACLIASVFILIIYGVSGRYNFNLNKGYNDEVERQVDILTTADKQKIDSHFKSVMRWNIKLSDFETLNYSLAWVSMIALLLYAIYAAVSSGLQDFGTIFSLVVYVFEFIGGVIALPLYLQQLIRLREISSRLNETESDRE